VKQNKIKSSITKYIENETFDLIHAYTLFTDGNVAMDISERLGIPFVVAVRGTDMNEFFTYRPYLINRAITIMRKASKVFFLSKQFMDRMISNFVPAKYKYEISMKSIVMPNGIDDFWLENINVNKEIDLTLKRIQNHELNILCVSQIMKDKNIPMVQSILHQMKKKGWKVKLDVVGKVRERSEYNKIISDTNTTYFKPLNKEELLYKYRENDVFIMLSHHESFGLVYAEAMSQGLPVIYTKGQGFDGQFNDGEIGYCASDKDVSDGVKKLMAIISDYKLISENCLRNCSVFDWSRIVKEYQQIYDEVVMKRKN